MSEAACGYLLKKMGCLYKYIYWSNLDSVVGTHQLEQ